MKTITLELDAVAEAIDIPLDRWPGQCHIVSLAMVQCPGLLPRSRVARGACRNVRAQHSWIVLGWDCYDPEATIIDPTLWTYDDQVDGIWIGTADPEIHLPHGAGDIWTFGRPAFPTGPVVELDVELSRDAAFFLSLAAPQGLDVSGWGVLARSPVGGWPAAEIIAAMDDTPALAARVPIDILGMLTDRNPGGMYF